MEDYLITLMFNMHVSQTAKKNPAFTHKVNINCSKLDIEKLKYVNENENNLKEYAKLCFDEFISENAHLSKGSLHRDPIVWTNFGLNSIYNAYCAKQNTVVFSNGCCSRDNCPINIYYLIVLKNIMLKE
jgi:hypothetical protein